MKKPITKYMEDIIAFIIQTLLSVSIVVAICLSIVLPVYLVNLGLRLLGLHQNAIYVLFMIIIFIVAIQEAKKEVNK